MSTIYEQWGMKPIIHASGTLTRLGGTLMHPEVLNAMVEAGKAFVPIDQMQARASKYIAEITGAEAAYVTSGSAAGLELGAAACMTGLDVDKMNRLPDTTGMKNEFIVQRSHRHEYDRAVTNAGAKFVEVGVPYHRKPYMIERAINENTAGILYHAGRRGILSVPLNEVCEMAHRHGVPVLVDNAGGESSRESLRVSIRAGADLVVFSGGKYIRGPQSTGFICGRKDLIAAVALQHLDMDEGYKTWRPPKDLIDLNAIDGPPLQGIGRGFKVCKEEFMGLLVALKRFVEVDRSAEQACWTRMVKYIVQGLEDVPRIKVTYNPVGERPDGWWVPSCDITLDEKALGFTAFDVILRLRQKDPPIELFDFGAYDARLNINPLSMHEGEEKIVLERLRELFLSS